MGDEGTDGQNTAARRYHSPRRVEQAALTRRAILAAARTLFVSKGYLATTVADIAREARVAVDTIYATVGRKPELLREVLETALSGTDHVVPGKQRDYVVRSRAAPSAREKFEAYIDGLVKIQSRLAPIFLAMRDAATRDVDSAALWTEISERRARNMRDFAADLRTTGELREDLSDDEVADIIWSMNAAEYWALLVGDRGWTHERFAAFLNDAWTRMFLAE
jgi:AcrR family transcriptional regulator